MNIDLLENEVIPLLFGTLLIHRITNTIDIYYCVNFLIIKIPDAVPNNQLQMYQQTVSGFYETAFYSSCQ